MLVDACVLLFESIIYAVFVLGSVVGVYLLWTWFWRAFDKNMKDYE